VNRIAYLPDLARSLGNHALLLAETGRRDDAVPVSEEAVAGYRELAAVNRAAYVPDLAKLVNNHAALLAEAGRRDEAVPVSEEAVAGYRELAAVNRAAYLPDLAMSLTNRALRLAEAGRLDEALPLSVEAVALRRELATLNQAAYLPDLATSLTYHAVLLVEAGRHDGAEAFFDDILSQFRASPLGTGHLLLARGGWRLTEGRLGEAVPDLTAAVGALTDTGDHMARASARQLLRQERQRHRETFDQVWSRANEPLPVWLRYPETGEDLVRIVVAWIEARDWEASKTHLQDRAAVLLTDQAEAALEHLIDANPATSTLPEHLTLLRAVRARGADAAYAAHQDQLLADRAIGILNEWFATQTWEQSQAFASAHADELLHPATAVIIGQASGEEPRNYMVRLHRGLLSYAAVAGFDAAYELLADTQRLRTTLAATEHPSDRLALARLYSGQSADDPEAHFQLAVTTLSAGNPDEAAVALADCADHAAPYERRDFSRRLGHLREQHPYLAQAIASLQHVLESGPSAEADQ
jgi:tetratricopeptide (TPR) repeat protein